MKLELEGEGSWLAPTIVLSNACVWLSSGDVTSPGHVTLIFSLN